MTQTKQNLSAGEEARFNELMSTTYRKVYNMAFRLSGNRTDAEDLTQEAFFRAYRSYKEYEGDRPFENWIFRIVTRLFLDLLRSRRRRVKTVSYDAPLLGSNGDDSIHFDVADGKATPEDQMLNMELNEDLQAVLSTLTAEQKMLIELADVQSVPYHEIAEMMGKPVGTIRSRLHRTHKLIKARLEKRFASKKPGMIIPGRLMPAS
jgi:RNA polymerase sigma-70 factor (ECF subfamily)